MQNRRFLITGGAGFIGSHLVDRLLANNAARIVVVDNFDDFYDPRIKRANISNHLKYHNYRLIEADIRQYSMLKQLIAGEEFDVIIHLASKAGVRPSIDDPHVYQDVNVTGTLNLLDLARRQGIDKFIYGSSSSIYGPEATIPFVEDAPLSPISPYASTKAAGELLAHTYSHLYGIRILCLRFFTVYGPRQRPDLAIHKFARLMINKRPIPVYGDGTSERDFTYIDDILQGVLASINYESTMFEVINLGESRSITVNQMIKLLEGALDTQAIIESHPPHPGDLQRTKADIEKARKLLGYQPSTPIEVGIQKFVEWLKWENQS